MRFIVDAQLPRLRTDHLVASGHDAVHAKQRSRAGAPTDAESSAFADLENRIVVTKDTDFQESHLLRGTPTRLLRVATGNIRNSDLIALFSRLMPALETAFDDADDVEMSATGLTAHPRPRR